LLIGGHEIVCLFSRRWESVLVGLDQLPVQLYGVLRGGQKGTVWSGQRDECAGGVCRGAVGNATSALMTDPARVTPGWEAHRQVTAEQCLKPVDEKDQLRVVPSRSS
jgi:hypothetical protein